MKSETYILAVRPSLDKEKCMFRFLIVLCCGLVFLLPSPAQAAPTAQETPCDPRGPLQNLLSNIRPDLFISEAGRSSLQINGIDITLHVCSTSLESATAQRMLQLIVQGLPRMSELSGLHYDGPTDRWILVVSKQELPPNTDGFFTDVDSIIRLTPDSPDWAVLHETAHYWANDRNFSQKEPWMAEGYADYLTERTMIKLGRSQRMETPSPICKTLPLMHWQYDIGTAFVRCAYDVGGAVFRDLAQQAGDAHFRTAVGEIANSDRITSDKLLDQLERLSGKDLTPIMRERVFPAEDDVLLDFRRKNWDTYDQATALAQQSGVALPSWIAPDLLDWNFNKTWPWLAALTPFLQAQSDYAARCAGLNLDCGHSTGIPETLDALTAATEQANAARTLLDQYTPLHAAAASLQLEVPTPIRAAAVANQPESAALIAAALAAIEHGKTLEQTCQLLSISCVPVWREVWNQGNMPETTAIISSTASVIERARRVDTLCGRELVETCHSLWRPQLEHGTLITATQTLNQLETLLQSASAREKACGAAEKVCHQLWQSALMHKDLAAAQAQLDNLATLQASAQDTEERCQRVRETCQNIWQAALQTTGIEGSTKMLANLDSLMQSATTIEGRCRERGYDCRQTWSRPFQQRASIAETQALLGRLTDILPSLQLAHMRAVQPPSGIVDKMNILFFQPQARLAAIQQALDQSDTTQAQALAQQLLSEYQQGQRIRYMLLIVLFLSPLVLVAGFRRVKMRSRRAQCRSAKPAAAASQSSADDLLTTLLANPPVQKKGKR
jgi:hypothetical protein